MKEIVKGITFIISSYLSNHPLLIFCNTFRNNKLSNLQSLNTSSDYSLLIKKYFNGYIVNLSAGSKKIKEIRQLRLMPKNRMHLRPILFELIDFLPQLNFKRLKKCKNQNCSHLFIDSGINNFRIWCSMVSYGNTLNARSFYVRSKF